MGKKFSRVQVLERLNTQRDMKRPIIAATAGNGLMAKLIEKGGADLILVYGTAYTRMQGKPSIARQEREEKELLREMIRDQFEVTEDIPLIAGISAAEYPLDADFGQIIDEYLAMGFSGITNFQTCGMIESEEFVRVAEQSPVTNEIEQSQHQDEMAVFAKARKQSAQGLGTKREEELLKAGRSRGIFTVAYTFTADQTERYIKAGADMIVGHCGGTAGGLVGHTGILDYDEAAGRLNAIFEPGRGVQDVFLMGHGGPFWNPDSTKEMYRLTGCDGYVSGSAIERIPVEKAVIEACRRFKEITI